MIGRFNRVWMRFWMRFAGRSAGGRLATRLATWFAPPYKARIQMAWMSTRGYISPSAIIYHRDLKLSPHVFIGDCVTVFQEDGGGPVTLGEAVRLYGDCLLETGQGGSITIGERSRVHRGCHLIAYKAPIQIGCDVGISQNCAFYSYNHGVAPGRPVSAQPLQTHGPIVIEDHAWLGVGVIVLDGVRIGNGAVIGAGAVVTRDIPDGAIASGVPARVTKMREALGERAPQTGGSRYD
jgi:acetyltransferase-like isoleucine patch superfamily enzyme